ncbi:MAG: hypothetical protein AABM64_11200 [Pseudomonadota bacterium]
MDDLDAELMHEIRISMHGGYAIADSRFREEVEHALNRRAARRGAARSGPKTGAMKGELQALAPVN